MIKYLLFMILSLPCLADTAFTKSESDLYLKKHFSKYVIELERGKISTGDIFELLQAIRLLNDPIILRVSPLGVDTTLVLISQRIAYLLERSKDLAYLVTLADIFEGEDPLPGKSPKVSFEGHLFLVLSALLLKTFNDGEIQQLLNTIHNHSGPISSAFQSIGLACTLQLAAVPNNLGDANFLALTAFETYMEALPELRSLFQNFK